MTNASPNFAEFKRLARQGNVVPVYRTIVADLLSPVSAFLSLSPQHGRELRIRTRTVFCWRAWRAASAWAATRSSALTLFKLFPAVATASRCGAAKL